MMQQVIDRMDKIDERFSAVEKKIDVQSEEVEVMKKGMKAMEEKVLEMEDRMIDQEARSRRNNLIFHGVRESPGENCFEIVSDLIQNVCKIKDSFVIERSHRIGRPATGNQRRVKPRPLIVKFLDYNMRERVMGCRRLLPPDNKVTEELPWQIRQARGSLKDEVVKAKRTARDVWVSYPARLMVNGREMTSVRPATMKRQHGGYSGRKDDVSAHQKVGQQE